MEAVIRETIHMVGEAGKDLLYWVFLIVMGAIGKAITAYVDKKTAEQEAKAKLADHETKKTIATDVAIAMEQSPDHVTKEEMKDGAVAVLTQKMPDENEAGVNTYAELGVVEKKKLNDAAVETPTTVDLQLKATDSNA